MRTLAEEVLHEALLLGDAVPYASKRKGWLRLHLAKAGKNRNFAFAK